MHCRTRECTRKRIYDVHKSWSGPGSGPKRFSHLVSFRFRHNNNILLNSHAQYINASHRTVHKAQRATNSIRYRKKTNKHFRHTRKPRENWFLLHPLQLGFRFCVNTSTVYSSSSCCNTNRAMEHFDDVLFQIKAITYIWR